MAKGRFIPKHPEKYMGNPANIIFRSSWELNLFKFLDNSSSVIRWASEELKIPYLHPIKQRMAFYFPDALVIYKDKNGTVRKEIIEIKPLKETVLTNKSSTYDRINIAINEAKWKAAIAFAQQHGLEFRVLTEASIFKNAAPAKPSKSGKVTKENVSVPNKGESK